MNFMPHEKTKPADTVGSNQNKLLLEGILGNPMFHTACTINQTVAFII